MRPQFLKTKRLPDLLPFFIGLLTLLLRLPFQSQSLFNWDSVNFALGILGFNILRHRPHPPGYILYIKLAQILNEWFRDPNSTLVWVSILSGILTVITVYAFAQHRFGTADAVIAALLTLTNPLLWFYDELALTYSLEALLSIAIAYACYRTVDGSRFWPYVGAILLGLSGGLRQTTMLLMLPLGIYTILFLSWKHRLFLTAIFGSICVAWGMALLQSTGGMQSYLAASQQLSHTLYLEPFAVIFRTLFYGGHVPLLFALAALLGLYRLSQGTLRTWERTFLFLWLTPGLLLISFFHLGQSGYILFAFLPLWIYTPALMKAAFRTLDDRLKYREGTRRLSVNARLYTLTGVVLIINVTAFLLGGLTLIRIQDHRWGVTAGFPTQFPPKETIIISGLDRVSGFRHASYYLPDYHVYGYFYTPLNGPFYFGDIPMTVPGWIFHSYQLEDNYDLNPETHQIHSVLNFPEGTKGLIVTNQELWEKLIYFNNNLQGVLEMTPIDKWFMYVKLPVGSTHLVACQNRLEIR